MAGIGTYDELVAENKTLKDAIRAAIPWIGGHREGPSWATSE